MDSTTETKSGLRRRVVKTTRCAVDLRAAGRDVAKDVIDIASAPVPCHAPDAFVPMNGVCTRATRLRGHRLAGLGGVVEMVCNARI